MKILLADDHKLMRQGIRSLISSQPDMSVVGEAEDGLSAVRMTAALAPDVVLMDISMPGLNGIEATRRIVEGERRPKVIGLSMYLDKRSILKMIDAGASGYLLKDCAFEEVIHAIRTVSASNDVYLSPAITEIVLKDLIKHSEKDEAFSLSSLTEKELEVLVLLADGLSTKEIAARIPCSVKSAEYYRKQIMEKLCIDNFADLIKFAVREGLVTL